jgi:hypothetical protein
MTGAICFPDRPKETTMDLGKAFSYVFDDPDWLKKVGLGGLIYLVPILNFAAAGYSVEVAQRVINGDPRPLPKWSDMGGKLVKGLLVSVIGLAYALPLFLVNLVMWGGMVAAGGAVGIVSSSPRSDEAIGGVMTVVYVCCGCLMLLYVLFAGLVLPAAIGNYAAKNQLSAAFRFRDVLTLVQKNLGTYLMVLVIELAAAFAASLVGSFLCGVGLYFTAFYALLVTYHAIGQSYRQASAQIGLV